MTRDAPAHSLTRAFTDLLGTWTAGDPALLDQCRVLLLDGVAVALAGAAEPGPALMAELVRAEAPSGPATLIGHAVQTAPIGAARANGMAMHVLDYEPMWNPPNHALSPLLPAILALAELREHQGAGPQGAPALQAIARGVEAQGRLRLSSTQIEPASLSLHPPGVVGPLAAALACGVMLGLEGERLAAAVAIAASRSAGLLANVGSMTKALHCGDAAAAGLESALLAARGFTANEDALGSPRGWGAAYFGAAFDPDPLLAAIHTPRALDPGPAWKLFPSQFATHFGITAALEARAAAGTQDLAHRIRHIELRTPPMPYIDRPRPTGGLDGKFSWQYTAVIALLDGAVTPGSFTDARRFAPDVETLLDRFTHVGDPTISGRFDRMHVDLTLQLVDGPAVCTRCDAPLGAWTRPVPPQRIHEKAAGLLGAARAASMMAAMAPEVFDVRALMTLLRPA